VQQKIETCIFVAAVVAELQSLKGREVLKFCREFSCNVLKKFLNDPDPKLKDTASDTLVALINTCGREHFTQTLDALNPARLKQIQNKLLQQTKETKETKDRECLSNNFQNTLNESDTNATNNDKFKLNKIGNLEIKKVNKKNSVIFEDPKKKQKK